jgi:hypothetical protein
MLAVRRRGSGSLATYPRSLPLAATLLESVKAVVNALAAGRITPFTPAPNKPEAYRYAPSFGPACSKAQQAKPYAALNVSQYLGRARARGKDSGQSDAQTRAALDALHLLEVKAITTAMIKDMNWSSLGKFVADIKAKREREILRTKKTAAEVAKDRWRNPCVEGRR